MKKRLLAAILVALAVTGCDRFHVEPTSNPTTSVTDKVKKEILVPTRVRVYVGTYTNGDSQGIYQFDLDLLLLVLVLIRE